MAFEDKILQNLSTMDKYGNSYGKQLAKTLRDRFQKEKSDMQSLQQSGSRASGQTWYNAQQDILKSSTDYLKSIGDRVTEDTASSFREQSGLLSLSNLGEGLTMDNLQGDTRNLLSTQTSPTIDVNAQEFKDLFSYIEDRRSYLKRRSDQPGLRAQTLLSGQGGLLT